MYQLLGDQVFDSKEVGQSIEAKTVFTVREDMTKRTKREDALAYKVSIGVKELNPNGKDFYDDENEIDELLVLADELSKSEFEKVSIENTLKSHYSYSYDEVKNEVLIIVVIMDLSNGRRKIQDVLKRLMSQV